MGQHRKRDCVLLFMPCLKMGGAEKQFWLLRKGLLSKGVCVITVLTSSDQMDMSDKIYSVRKEFNFIKKEFEIWKLVHYFLQDYSIKCAIVYDVYAQFAIPFLRMCGIRVLFSERNSGEHKCRISRNVICMANIITANSLSAIMNMHKYVRKEVHYIPNGVEIKDISNDLGHEFSKQLKIIVPARIAPVKNQMLVIKAIENIKNIEVHFAGKINDENYFQSMQKYIKERGLKNRFIYDGFVSDMNSHYKKFDMILLPSISEGTSNVILEAFAMKKICVASDIKMNEDVVPRKELLFRSGDAESLRTTILTLLKMESYRITDILNDCYRYICENYSTEKMVDSYWELIKHDTFEEV